MKRAYTHLKTISLLGLTFALAFVMSCSDDNEPKTPDIRVAFSFSPENPEAGELVTFTNASTGGAEFVWDFGDGGSSTDENPTYTFEGSGVFTVSLTVDGHADLVTTKDITVGDPVPVIS